MGSLVFKRNQKCKIYRQTDNKLLKKFTSAFKKMMLVAN